MKKVSPSFRNGLAHFAVLLAVLAMSSVAFAQSGSSSVRGVVNDLQGRAVAGANVSLINEQKNFNRSQTSNDSGAYVFTAVPAGTYRIEIEDAGLKKASIIDVQALVDTPTNQDVQLS